MSQGVFFLAINVLIVGPYLARPHSVDNLKYSIEKFFSEQLELNSGSN